MPSILGGKVNVNRACVFQKVREKVEGKVKGSESDIVKVNVKVNVNVKHVGNVREFNQKAK